MYKFWFLFQILIAVVTLVRAGEITGCNYGGFAHKMYSKSCCWNETYELGHGIKKHSEECYQQLIDDRVPYTENHWAYYECVVNKTLYPEPLEDLVYYEMMLKNLSFDKKTKILNALINNRNRDEIPKDYRQRLKYFWVKYFNAEYSICAKEYLLKCRDKFCVTKGRRDYEPKLFCRPTQTDDKANYFRFTRKKYDECMETEKGHLRPHFNPQDTYTPQNIQERAQMICRLKATSHFDTQELKKPDCNFRSIYEYSIPRFLSMSSRSLFLNNYRKLMARKGIKLQDGSTPFVNFILNFPNGKNINNLDEHGRYLTNLNAALTLTNVAEKTRIATCEQQWL